MRRVIPGLLALWVGASIASAQFQDFEPAGIHDPAIRQELPRRFEAWRSEHGSSWYVRQDPATGYARMLFGGSTEPLMAPQSEVDWFAVGRHAVSLSAELHGVDPALLVEDRVKLLPLSLAGTTDKMSIQFRQAVQGVPVVKGFVNVIAATDGAILAIDNTGMPGLDGFDVTPAISADAAVASVARWFRQDAGSPATFVGEARLVIDQVDQGSARAPVLAWEVEARRLEQGIEPAGWVYRVDAETGALANRETTIHHFDVSGTVSSFATPGTLPDQGGNQEAVIPMPHMTVNSPQGSAVTDANGDFNIVGATAPLNVTVRYAGPYHVALNMAQADFVLNTTLTNATGNGVLMNSPVNDLTTPEANSHLWVNNARDWIKFIDPTDTTADFQALSNLNLPSSCNAFFNGVSINFYPQAGGCVNTAFSTVVVHELGHWYQVLYGTGNGSDGMGEGGADIWAMYTTDTPIVGQDFFGPGSNIRDGNNVAQYWGDGNPCNLGGVHACGQVFMGSMWKMLLNLRASHGTTMGRIMASSLYLGWQNGFNQTKIEEIIVDQLMTLDDNDGNIHNGTPNAGDINSAFLAHGFNGFTPDFMTFQNVTVLADTQNQSGPYTVDATILPNLNPAVSSANLMVSVDGGSFVPTAMTNTGGTSWTADISGQSCITDVRYYLEATDSGGVTESFPEGGAQAAMDFLVGNVSLLHAEDFDPASAWTSGAPSDTATTGIWEHGDPIGDGVQPDDDHTQDPGSLCWFTGQGTPGAPPGLNDIDNGTTTLTTSVYDLSSSPAARISYWRWYANNGNSLVDDVFTIDITNNGVNWVNVETLGPAGQSVGWKQHEFTVADFVPPTSTVQLRFVAADGGQGSIVEAAIDDFRVDAVSNDCTGAFTYCQGKLNTAGCVPFITTINSASATSSQPFRIIGNDVAPNETGLLIYGINGKSKINFHNGKLCVKLPFIRLLPFKKSGNSAGGQCRGEFRVNFNNRIQGGIDTTLTVGQRVHAQWFYRDPGIDFFNDGLTNGVEFTIQP